VRVRDRVGKHGPLGAWRLPGGLTGVGFMPSEGSLCRSRW